MERNYITAVLLLIVCAIALSVAAHIFTVFPFDLAISHKLREVENPIFTAVMQYVSIPGNNWMPVAMITAATVFLLIRRQYLNACFVFLTMSSIFFVALLKFLVGRPRPPTFIQNPTDIFILVDRYSYPSGHVLFYVVFFGFIVYLSFRHLTGLIRWVSIFVCTALIVLVAPSRIYLGAHWASDVLGSYVIGGLLLLMIILCYRIALSREETGNQIP